MQEKKKYIFPEDWDITDAFKAADNNSSEEGVYKGEDKYLIYGDGVFNNEKDFDLFVVSSSDLMFVC